MNFYKSPLHAWGWVILLHRLAAKPADTPLKLIPSKSSSALRMRVFGGRQYIEERPPDCKHFGRYINTSKETRIKNLQHIGLLIHQLPDFSQEYTNIKLDNFSQVLHQFHRFAEQSTGESSTLGGFEPLNSYQIEALRTYITAALAPRTLIITPQSLSITKRRGN